MQSLLSTTALVFVVIVFTGFSSCYKKCCANASSDQIAKKAIFLGTYLLVFAYPIVSVGTARRTITRSCPC